LVVFLLLRERERERERETERERERKNLQILAGWEVVGLPKIPKQNMFSEIKQAYVPPMERAEQ
jgi:hypothetical protein